MFRYTIILALVLGLPAGGWSQEKKRADDLPDPTVCRLGSATSIVFSSDGKEVATCRHGDSFVRFWDAATGKPLRKLDALSAGVAHFAFSPDGKQIAACGMFTQEMHVGVWDTGTFKNRFKLKDNLYNARLVAISEDGKRLAGVGGGTTPADVVIWDFQTGKKLAHHPALAAQQCQWAAFLSDGCTLVVEGKGGFVLWDFEADRIRTVAVKGLAIKGLSTALSPDGRILAVTGERCGLTLTEIATGAEIWHERDLRGSSNGSLAFAPNGRVVAVSDNSGTVRLVDWTAPDRRLSFKAAVGGPTQLAFSPDGSRLAGVFGNAKVWDVADFVRRPLAKLDKIDPDGRDGSFKVLTSTSGKQANQGIFYLAAEGDAVIPRLKTVLAPAPAKPLKDTERWISDLDSGNYVVREKAEKRLLALGPDVMPLLGNALKNPRSLEQRRRLEAILKALDDFPLAHEDRLRQTRGIAVLEHIGTPDARAALIWLAKGNPCAFQTQQAQAALRRLERCK